MKHKISVPVLDSLEPRLLLSGDLFITEFMAANTATITDNTGQYSDWLEIHNASANDINLLGYHLTDDGADRAKWPLPDMILPAGEFLLIFANDNDQRDPAAELHTNFKLSAGGELLALVAPDQSIEHAYQPNFPDQSADISYGLSLDFTSQGFFPTPTPGQPNTIAPVTDARQQIVISEIMYHPISENDLEEYIEIHNIGQTAVDLTGWQITRGIDFIFPATTIAPGEHLVIAANPATFATTYPAAPAALGPWLGHLRNRGETINLVADDGTEIDEVRFADEGDWATRQLDEPDHGHQGWVWETAADAGGKSIELININLDNDQGQNWQPSIPDGGTPGQPNSVAATDIAPLISNVTHYPIIPTASEPVTITATITDEQPAATLTASLYYRIDGQPDFTQIPMIVTIDGNASATIPAMPDGAVIEYYVEATDAQNNTRTWPAPTQPDNQQSANALYQVDDSFDISAAWTPGQQPVYYLIMTEAQRAEMADIGDAEHDDIEEQESNAQMNGTFIALNGEGIDLRYNVGIRNRGHGSRTGPPNNYRVNFPHDNPWQGVTAININKLSAFSQVLGSAIHKLAGHQPADAMAVQVRVNGQDLAEEGYSMYGSYAAVEVLDGDYTDNHFPDDSDGNLYKCLDSYVDGEEADLRYEGDDPDAYRDTYYKQTNDYLDDWSDLIELTILINNTDIETYYNDISAVVNVEQWVSYLALDTLLGNTEGGLITGRGDDYALYRGVEDHRFIIVPHDLDSLLRGSTQRDILSYTAVPSMSQFLSHPDITPLYYQALLSHINTFYNPETIFPLMDQITGFITEGRLDDMKQFLVDRIENVLVQIPREFTIDSSLPLIAGYYRASGPNALLFGTADAAQTRSILVNGQPVYYNPLDGSWSTGGFSSGGNDTLVDSGEVWQFLDNGSDQTHTGWQNLDYTPDSAWGEGPAQLGYGDGDEATVVSDGRSSSEPHITFYFRKTITINSVSDITNLDLSLLRDDGAIVYINGNEVIRSNMPDGPVDNQTLAAATASDEDTFNNFAIDPAFLTEGDNVISVEVHQRSTSSSDVSFDMSLTITRSDTSTETLITQGDQWHYLDDGSDQSVTDWTLLSYTLPATWSLGTAQFGYGDSDEITILDAGGGSSSRAITTYFRKSFTPTDIDEIGSISMMLLRDDGAVVYLNGVEILRNNMPATGTIDYQTLSTGSVTSGEEDAFIGPHFVNPALLVEGENIIAVEIHQRSTTSSDISFDLQLIAARGETSGGTPITPGLTRMTVEAYDGPDGTGNLVNSETVNVWYENPGTVDPTYTAADIASVEVITRDSYLPGTAMLVQVIARDDQGNILKDLYDATATLSTTSPDVTLPDTDITLYNGRGSTLITPTGSGDLSLDITLGEHTISRTITSLELAPADVASGTLAADTIWNGIIHVNGDLLIPAGVTLTINPGTLVLIDGNPALESTDGIDIDVEGTLLSLGTAAQPVTFTAADPAAPWGEIHHENASPSTYQYTFITVAGHSPQGGHTGTGPAIRSNGSTITLDNSAITDVRGKTMQVMTSELVFTDSLFARSVMGPEIEDSSLLMQNTYITDMLGLYREDGYTDDDDGIYIHRQLPGQLVTIEDSVVANGDDDGIDTLGADVTITNTIIRDYGDKGISIISGTNTITDTIITGTDIGISAKVQDGSGHVSNDVIDHVTIAAISIAIESNDKFGIPDALINLDITNSILNAPDAIRTDYDPAQITVNYSNLTETWTGTGNTTADPLFANPPLNDYHLQPGSPAVDAGDPASTLDPDGSLPDAGYYRNGDPVAPITNTLGPITLTENLTLSPTNGPWTITGEINVPTGYTLTIEPGTTLYFEDGARIMIDGGLFIAEGTRTNPILFTKTGSANAWGGIQFNNTLLDNRISYATLQFGITSDGMVGLDWSNLTITHSTFDHTDRRRIRSQNSSLIVRDSVFTDIFPGDMAPTTDNQSEHLWGGHINPGGHFIIERNYFGTTKGHNDGIDFDAGTRGENPVPQYINNFFMGAGDDLLDLEGDSYIEGNIFMHVHKDAYNVDPGESNTISAGDGHEYMVVNNVFYDIGHVSLVKEASFMTFLHNTVVNASLEALYFELPGETSGPGIGGIFESNIFTNVAQTFDYLELTTDFTANNNIVADDALTIGTGNFNADPRIADIANQDFSLLPGSPAIGAAPGGYNLGALVPGGKAILITGEPQSFTTDTAATLNVYAPGYIAYKYRVNGGQWSDEQSLDTPIILNNLADGQYTVEVIAQNWAYSWIDESEAVATLTWAVDNTTPQVIINEIMANNESFTHEGTAPDMIELHNPSAIPVDISGYTITDDPTRPDRYTFPANTIIQPGGYLTLYADSATTSGIHLGFGLDRNGEAVYLYDTTSAPVDSVEFGIQPADHSLGRTNHNRTWTITQPTFGFANQELQLGNRQNLKINEWGANGDIVYNDDFIEIYNPDPFPVFLDGLHLTDDPVATRDKFTIAPLSFIAANGFTLFKADNNTGAGLDHTNFKLATRLGSIGLFNTDLSRIDQVFYYASTIDTSHGLTTDGQPAQQAFSTPTPGQTNNPIITPIPGDANGDGTVGLLDLDALGNNWGRTDGNATLADGDFNGDGNVTLLDLDILGRNWGTSAIKPTQPTNSLLWQSNNQSLDTNIPSLLDDIDEEPITLL